MWKLFGENQELCGLIGAHVDDLLCTGAGKKYKAHIEALRNHFPFGSWTCSKDQTVVFCGCELSQHADFSITLQQERFSLSLDEIPLSRERKQHPEYPATNFEAKRMRGVLGGLSWRGVQSAPWLCASISHLQGCHSSATVQDIMDVNKLVRSARKHAEVGLRFMTGIKDPIILTFSDASWATRRDLSSPKEGL